MVAPSPHLIMGKAREHLRACESSSSVFAFRLVNGGSASAAGAATRWAGHWSVQVCWGPSRVRFVSPALSKQCRTDPAGARGPTQAPPASPCFRPAWAKNSLRMKQREGSFLTNIRHTLQSPLELPWLRMPKIESFRTEIFVPLPACVICSFPCTFHLGDF